MVFQCRIISPNISFASSRLENSQASAISPPKTSRLYSLGITVSGPAIRAEKNPSSSSTFIALPPLQLLRKSPRRSSSASLRGSGLVKMAIVISRHSRQLLYDTTPRCPLTRRLERSAEYRLCGRSFRTPTVIVIGSDCTSAVELFAAIPASRTQSRARTTEQKYPFPPWHERNLAVDQNPKRRAPRACPEDKLSAARRAAQHQGCEREARRERNERGEHQQASQEEPDQADAFAAGLGLRTFIILSFRGDKLIDSSPACPCCAVLSNFNNLRLRQHEAFVTSH